jgi:hypothetical protein
MIELVDYNEFITIEKKDAAKPKATRRSRGAAKKTNTPEVPPTEENQEQTES